MENDHKKNMHSLSNNMVELFIGNILEKNSVDPNRMKLSDGQKESLRQSFYQLQEQVDNFMTKAAKQEQSDETQQTTLSPLREKFLKRRQQKEEK